MILQRPVALAVRRCAVTSSRWPNAHFSAPCSEDSKDQKDPEEEKKELATTAAAVDHLKRREPIAGGGKFKTLNEIRTKEDLVGPGALPGTVPSDLEQATGLERLELLGKLEGIDIFDMKPLDSSRKGTMDNPIMVKSFGEEQYAGCSGHPPGSHDTRWLTMTRDRPIERCDECGNVLKMDYLGPEHVHPAPQTFIPAKSFIDYIKPEYRYR